MSMLKLILDGERPFTVIPTEIQHELRSFSDDPHSIEEEMPDYIAAHVFSVLAVLFTRCSNKKKEAYRGGEMKSGGCEEIANQPTEAFTCATTFPMGAREALLHTGADALIPSFRAGQVVTGGRGAFSDAAMFCVRRFYCDLLVQLLMMDSLFSTRFYAPSCATMYRHPRLNLGASSAPHIDCIHGERRVTALPDSYIAVAFMWRVRGTFENWPLRMEMTLVNDMDLHASALCAALDLISESEVDVLWSRLGDDVEQDEENSILASQQEEYAKALLRVQATCRIVFGDEEGMFAKMPATRRCHFETTRRFLSESVEKRARSTDEGLMHLFYDAREQASFNRAGSMVSTRGDACFGMGGPGAIKRSQTADESEDVQMDIS